MYVGYDEIMHGAVSRYVAMTNGPLRMTSKIAIPLVPELEPYHNLTQ